MKNNKMPLKNLYLLFYCYVVLTQTLEYLYLRELKEKIIILQLRLKR